jgi:hypothetical protein
MTQTYATVSKALDELNENGSPDFNLHEDVQNHKI